MADPAIPAEISKPVLLRHYTGEVDPKRPHKNVDYEWLEVALKEGSPRSATLKAELQEKFDVGEYTDVENNLREKGLYPFN